LQRSHIINTFIRKWKSNKKIITERHFFIEVNGKTEVQITYVWEGNKKFVIDHSEVNYALKGKRVGKQMVVQYKTFAREHQLKIMPLFPLAKALLIK